MPDLKSFENKHEGCLAFILGAGPSLHFQDVSPLKDYITFAVNSGILKYPKCDYFVSDDIAAREWNWYKVTAKSSNCYKLLFKKKLEGEADLFGDKVVWYDHVPEHNPDFDCNNKDGYRMMKDANEPIIGARTSAGSAVHLALIMGCEPIVLLGCDSCYRNGKRYFWQFPGESKAVRVNSSQPVYCRADKGKRRNKAVDQHCCDFDEYWDRVSDMNDINIIYASEGGLIRAFPSMTLEEVLNRYGYRVKGS